MMRDRSYYQKKFGPAAKFIEEFKARHGSDSLPWSRAYNNIMSRCGATNTHKSKYYSDKGVRGRISCSELRALFYRDRAWEMAVPSVDRINPEGDYTADNVRWLDFSVNQVQRLMSNPYRNAVYIKLLGVLVDEFNANNWPIYVRKAFLRKAFVDICGEVVSGIHYTPKDRLSK